MDDHIQLSTFTLPLHHLSSEVKLSLDELLESFKSQFVKDETSVGITYLTKIQINTDNPNPVLQKPYPVAMKHCDLVKDEINKILDVKVIHSSHSSWSAPIIVVLKDDAGKCLVINYRSLNKVIQKFVWPMPKGKDISKLNGAKYFSTLELWSGYLQIPPVMLQYLKQPSHHLLENLGNQKFLSD